MPLHRKEPNAAASWDVLLPAYAPWQRVVRGTSPDCLRAQCSEAGCGMSAPLDLDPAAVVARTLAKLRAAGLLRPEPAPEPAAPEPAGPQRGPRRCPQRNRCKRVLKGPRARQPLRSGQHPPGLRSLWPRR
jgi:hypothetical protein